MRRRTKARTSCTDDPGEDKEMISSAKKQLWQAARRMLAPKILSFGCRQLAFVTNEKFGSAEPTRVRSG